MQLHMTAGIAAALLGALLLLTIALDVLPQLDNPGGLGPVEAPTRCIAHAVIAGC